MRAALGDSWPTVLWLDSRSDTILLGVAIHTSQFLRGLSQSLVAIELVSSHFSMLKPQPGAV